MPDGVVKIGRAVVFINHYLALPTRDKYSDISSVGSTSFDLLIATEDRHKVGYIITWYINYRGEKGPESDPEPFDTV